MKPSKPATVAAYWHPNFRVEASLPDTKVVRTSFVINAAVVVLMLGLGVILYVREAASAEVRAQSAEWSRYIAENRPKYDKAVKMQTEFSDAEKKVREIEAFVASRMIPADFLKIISATLPRLITIDSVEMRADGVQLRGTVVGSSERSAPLAKAYADQLAANPALKAQMESVKLNSQSRDQEGNRFVFEIELKFKASKVVAPLAKKQAAAAKQQEKVNDE